VRALGGSPRAKSPPRRTAYAFGVREGKAPGETLPGERRGTFQTCIPGVHMHSVPRGKEGVMGRIVHFWVNFRTICAPTHGTRSTVPRRHPKEGSRHEHPTLFTGVREETVPQIAGALTSVPTWRQETAESRFVRLFVGFRGPYPGPIPLFQTVSEGKFREVRTSWRLRAYAPSRIFMHHHNM
jgi:hypothetical protein